MKQYAQALYKLWKGIPVYLQVPIIALVLFFAFIQTLGLGRELGRALYRVLH